MTPIGDVEVIALAKLIYKTAGELVQQYNSTGHSVPSLDSTDPGPLDSGKIPADLSRQIRIIVGACAQLSTTVNRPSQVISARGHSFIDVACLKVVCEAKIADYLLNASDGVHINELAAKCGLDPGKLGRILHLLATTHCFKEVEPDVFANNRISIQLCSNNPVSSWVGFLTDEASVAGCNLSDTIFNPEFASSLSPDHTAFKKAFASSFFDFYAIPANIKQHERFTRAMVGVTEVIGKDLLAEAIPWGSAPEGATICDIAGGNGHITLGLAKEFLNLHVIVQDVPGVIEQAKQYWNEKFPEAVRDQRVQFVEFDFFKDSPVPNCRWYYIRHIIHDWPDAECVKILSNIRKVMSADSRLFINDFVLESTLRENGPQGNTDQAPEPLLNNYGLGRIQPYQQDILMMMIFNSQERKLPEIVSLAAQAGLKYERLIDAGEEKVVEFSRI